MLLEQHKRLNVHWNVGNYVGDLKSKLQMSLQAKTTAQQKWRIVRREYMFRASCRHSSAAVLKTDTSQCNSEMARQLETYSKVELRGTIRFLWAKRLNCTDIHREILVVYGPHAISRPAIVKWCQLFDQGRTDLGDEHREGRPSTTDNNVQAIEEMIRNNHRVTIADVAEKLRMSIGSAHAIVRDRLQYRKLCARWVPRSLTPAHKDARFMASLDFLQRYSAEGNDFLSRIIMGDETWVHHFTPETK